MSEADVNLGREKFLGWLSIFCDGREPIKRRCRKHTGRFLKDIIKRLREHQQRLGEQLSKDHGDIIPPEEAVALNVDDGLAADNPSPVKARPKSVDAEAGQIAPPQRNLVSYSPDDYDCSSAWVLNTTTLAMLIVHWTQFLEAAPAVVETSPTFFSMYEIASSSVLSPEESASLVVLISAAVLAGFALHIRHTRERIAMHDRMQRLFWILTWSVVCICSGYGLYHEKFSFKSKLHAHVQRMVASPLWVASLGTVAATATVLNYDKVLSLIGVSKKRRIKHTNVRVRVTQEKTRRKTKTH